jgi:hypothetical protein
MSIITKPDFSSEFLQEVFVSLPSEGKLVFLKNYEAAAREVGRPVSEGLTQAILAVAADAGESKEARRLAFSIAQTLVNPFSGNLVQPSQLDKTAGVVLVPGKTLAGTDLVFITAFEPTNREGEKLGRKLAFFAAPENLPGDPQSFNQNIAKIGGLKGWHGRDGWNFDPKRCGTSSYEGGLFKGYQDGSAIGTLTAPLLELVNGGTRDKRQTSGVENMLVLSKNPESPLYNTFITIPGSFFAKWSQSCTELRDYPANVHSVHFPAGGVSWDYKGARYTNRSCVRPVVALELSHLTIK